MTVRAFRRCIVRLDAATMYVGPENLDDWQEPRDIRLPDSLRPGDHVLQITVLNRDAQPCLLAYSEKLGIHTGPGWTVVQPDGRQSAAITVTQPTQPEVAQTYPSVSAAAIRIAPVLAVVFALTFAWSLWTSRTRDNLALRQLRPEFVRWGLLAAWVILAANNIGQIHRQVGFDMAKHFEYVQYIAEHRSLPLANKGWEMFQPPLFLFARGPLLRPPVAPLRAGHGRSHPAISSLAVWIGPDRTCVSDGPDRFSRQRRPPIDRDAGRRSLSGADLRFAGDQQRAARRRFDRAGRAPVSGTARRADARKVALVFCRIGSHLGIGHSDQSHVAPARTARCRGGCHLLPRGRFIGKPEDFRKRTLSTSELSAASACSRAAGIFCETPPTWGKPFVGNWDPPSRPRLGGKSPAIEPGRKSRRSARRCRGLFMAGFGACGTDSIPACGWTDSSAVACCAPTSSRGT